MPGSRSLTSPRPLLPRLVLFLFLFFLRGLPSGSSSLIPLHTFIAFQYANTYQTYRVYIYIYIYKCTVYVCICNQPSYRDEAVKVNDPNTKYSDEVCRNTHRTPHVPCTAHANGKCRKIMTSLNSSCIKLRTRTFTHANTLMETFVHG